MKRLVTALGVFLIALSISGCSQKTVSVPQKCRPPVPQKPIIDQSRCTDILECSKQCLSNYTRMKSYAIELEEANKVCQ